jgi:endonuclease/exonuclease/phosphatase family metal-dependent hydrolase
MSYNIHRGIGGIDRKYKPERIAEVIAYYNSNIVILQEVDDGVRRSNRHRQVDWLADALGYEHRVFQANVILRRGCYGNAILSHYPLSKQIDINLTVPPKKRRRGLVIQTRIDCDGVSKSIVLANVHLGLAAYERTIQVCRLMDNPYISTTPYSIPVILGGDFNDVWGNLCRKVLNAEGFTSALGKSKTFPAGYPMRSLDRIFHRGNLQVVKAFVGHIDIARVASDHLPIIADFIFNRTSET